MTIIGDFGSFDFGYATASIATIDFMSDYYDSKYFTFS